MSEVRVTINHKPIMVVAEKEIVPSRHAGKTEEIRTEFVNQFANFGAGLLAVYFYGKFGTMMVMAADPDGATKIRTGMHQIIDVFTAIAEPVLWFYAVIACILMATGKNKDNGWQKLKNVGYSYIAIRMIPAFFAFLGWISNLFSGIFTNMH